ncbi:MAG TPA: transcription termination/antitermination NusG family protein [Tepidisphaeraceae bacterium]|nr:transcription termination/antitermination NusG family protein [Tepidisphaeraceae bacterium]
MHGSDYIQHSVAELSMFRAGEPRQSQSPPILRADTAAQWHVLRVRSRQEKALCRDLAQSGIGHYLPLVQRGGETWRQARKVVCRKPPVDLPLYTGYVFLLGTIEQAFAADRTGRVVRIIPVFNQEQTNWELANLQLAMHHRPTLLPHPFTAGGTRVEVCGGPFHGLQGVIETRSASTARHRLILQVTAITKAVSLEVDSSRLRRID